MLVDWQLASLPVYVVSARDFHERHKHMNDQATACGLKLEFIYDYDCIELAHREEDVSMVYGMSLPVVSCLLKHLKAMHLVVERRQKIALILEDDCIFLKNFGQRLLSMINDSSSLRENWLIFLGGADNAYDIKSDHSSENSLYPSNLTTAEAYLVDLAGCQKRLKWLTRNLPKKPFDHFVVELDQEIGIAHYRPSVPMATQGSITGRFQTHLDQSRARKASWFLLLKYYSARIRKQHVPRFFAKSGHWFGELSKRWFG